MSPSTPPRESRPGADAEVPLPSSSPLQSCPHCEALIDATEREPLETISCPGCGEALTINGEIAGLQLMEVAGRGGMGVVYKAYDPSLDRHIAIKLLRKDHSADKRLIEQLETEATITASITDSHVVRVYATGLDRGRFFIAMELVDQGSLDDLIRLQTRIAEAQVLQVGIQIAQGLRAANQHGLIHRDVKPGNILFADAHTAKIVDFGLALFMNQVDGANTEIWGTPYYLAPEKLDGGAEDFRSDIYSLGASLFHALAGRPPFEAETATLVALKHLKSQAVSLQAFAPWVSNPTAHIINKTLAKNPSDRYQSYDDLIHNMEYALEQLQSGGSASPSRSRVVLETDEDRKTWTWVVLGMAAVMIILLVGFFVLRPKPSSTAATGKKATVTSSVPEVAKKTGFDAELAALVSRDPKAAELFQAISNNDSTSATDKAWAQLFEGVAHLLAGRGLEAKSAFDRVGPSASRMKDQELAAFLAETSQKMARREPISVAEAQVLNRSNHQALGYLLHGLNAWFNGRHEVGLSLLRQFRSTTPAGPNAWIADLKPLSTILVEEIMALQMGTDQLRNARTIEERVEVAKALRKLGPTFAPRVEALILPHAAEIKNFQQAIGKFPGPGIYRLVNKHTNKCMDVLDHGRTDGAKVVQWDSHGGANQMWEVIPREEGIIGLRSVHSGLFLDMPNGSKVPDTNVHLWTEKDDGAEKWRLEPKDGPWFFLRNMESDQVLGVFNMRQENGTAIIQWNKPGSADHFWRFEWVGTRVGPWVSADIGNVSKPGETTLNGGTLTMTAQTGDIWGPADSFLFTFQEIVGDFDFSARVLEISDVEQFAKVGLMVRGGAAPREPALFLSTTAKRGVAHQTRLTSGAEYTESPRTSMNNPRWLKLSRRGQEFTTFQSTDSVTWTQVGKESVRLGKEATVGIALSSQHHKQVTAKVDQIAIKQ